ncbi:hypothetical protein [Cytophaga aurantiaca]|uniref:hypothetical protein n=1 Tax=Cytophaga aurantiaca TaxID=29530 RepID=UPI00036876EA|nr:hypothetical protein [Cytophaga aurantiaca]
MRFLILSTICFCTCITGFAQKKKAPTFTTVDVAGIVQYQISMEWTEISDFKDKRTGTEFINFQRIPIQTDTAKLFVVTQSCKVENARGAGIKAYSVPRLEMFKKKKDFKIVKTFTNSDGLLKVAYSIGYWAYYTDENNIVHKIVIIHGIHKNGFGFQFFIDCPKDVFPALEQEITAQISSIKFL